MKITRTSLPSDLLAAVGVLLMALGVLACIFMISLDRTSFGGVLASMIMSLVSVSLSGIGGVIYLLRDRILEELNESLEIEEEAARREQTSADRARGAGL